MISSLIYRCTFLRHGESIGNMEKRFQGHMDYPLTDNGRLQANALAERWKDEGRSFDLVISSPLARARETAEIICSVLGAPLEMDAGWQEIDNGLLAGLTREDADRTMPRPQFITPYTRIGRTGESRWELYLRAGRNIQQLLNRQPGSYLVTAHGGILTMALYAILGIPLQADSSGPRFMFQNTTFADFTYEPEEHNWRLWNFDFRLHMKEDESD